MQGIDPDKVCFVVAASREMAATGEPDEQQPGSWAQDGHDLDHLAAGAESAMEVESAMEEELRCFLETLNHDELVAMLALTWLGRGDYESKDWPVVQAQARERINDRVIDYLLGIPMLPDYLEEALAQFGETCENY